MIFPLFKTWLAPFLPSNLRSSSNNNKAYKSPGSGFVTIGGGGGASSRSRQGPHTSSHITANMTFDNESEEHIVKGNGDMKMQHMHSTGGTQRALNTIVVSKQVRVTTEDYNSERSAESFQRV